MKTSSIYFYIAVSIYSILQCHGEENCGCLPFDPVFDILNQKNPNVTLDKEVFFYLYTKSHKQPHKLRVNDKERLEASTFDAKHRTKVIVHGYGGNGFDSHIQEFPKNYLHCKKYNVIVVDWGRGAKRTYDASRQATRLVGLYIAQLLQFLEKEAGLSLSDAHIVGHSLGAHIAGYAGLNLKGKVGRITGLDPAGLGFEKPKLVEPNERLDSSDAQFVDVIHTNAGVAGFVQSIGHADFFPNGGKDQPNCPAGSILSCNHIQALTYMADSIRHPKDYEAVKCDSYETFKSSECGDNASTTYMGEKDSDQSRGNFYLKTS